MGALSAVSLDLVVLVVHMAPSAAVRKICPDSTAAHWCRAVVKSRTGTHLFSILFRLLTTVSHPFNRGLLYLYRGPTGA
jgi:hypothetical protein